MIFVWSILCMFSQGLYGSWQNLAEVESYSREIDDHIKSFPASCARHSGAEIESVPKRFKKVTVGIRETVHEEQQIIGRKASFAQLMEMVNCVLKKYTNYQKQLEKGRAAARLLLTSHTELFRKFEEEYESFEENKRLLPKNKVVQWSIYFCGQFFEKPNLMYALADNGIGVTEVVYKYIKELSEDIICYTSFLEEYYELRSPIPWKKEL